MNGSVFKLDVRGKGNRFVYHTERGAAVQLSYSAAHLLERRAAGADLAVVANEFAARMGRTVDISEIEAAYAGLDEQIFSAEESDAGVPRGFVGKFCIFPGTFVDRIALKLSVLFEPRTCVVVLATALATIAGTLVLDGISLSFDAASFWLGYALFIGSLVIHEFGHASAARRFGAVVGDIGATMYLVYPALFTDVTSAWRLSRAQRVTVDIGGVFFQLVVAAVALVSSHVFHLEAARVGAMMMLASCAFSLNPFLRNDGYWLLSDALGIANFGRASFRSLRWRREGAHRGPALMTLMAYGAASILVGVGILFAMVLALIHVMPIVPALVIAVIHDVLVAHRPPTPRAFSMLIQSVLPALFIVSLVLKYKRSKSRLRRVSGEPIRIRDGDTCSRRNS